MKKFFLFLTAALAWAAANGCQKSDPQPQYTTDTPALLLDVRSAGEYASGHLEGAKNIPHQRIGEQIALVAGNKNTPIYIYCRSGRRVKIAMQTLEKLGYKNLHDYGSMENAAKKLDKAVVK